MSVILCDCCLYTREVGVVGSGYGNVHADGVAADDESAGMDACASDCSFQLAGILDGVGFLGVLACFGCLQGRRADDGILEVHLHAVGQAVGDGFAEHVALLQRQFLHACHILDAVLGGHGGVGDDVGAVFVPVLVHHPLQHLASSVVVKVGVDIGQRDTVGVEESLKQEVVFHGVQFGDAQAVGHHGACCRTSSGSHPYAQFLACGVDEVLHDEEISWEAHRLHDVQFKPYAVIHLLVQRTAVETRSTLVGQLMQIVGLKLDAVQLVISAQLLDFLLALLGWQLVFAILVAGELSVQVFFREFPSPFLFRAKVLRYGEEGHDGVALYVVGLHFAEHLASVCQCLGDVLEDVIHLLAGLEPFLFAVEHARGVVQVLASGQTEQMVVGFGIILVHKVAVVAADELHTIFVCQFYEHLVGLLL